MTFWRFVHLPTRNGVRGKDVGSLRSITLSVMSGHGKCLRACKDGAFLEGFPSWKIGVTKKSVIGFTFGLISTSLFYATISSVEGVVGVVPVDKAKITMGGWAATMRKSSPTGVGNGIRFKGAARNACRLYVCFYIFGLWFGSITGPSFLVLNPSEAPPADSWTCIGSSSSCR